MTTHRHNVSVVQRTIEQVFESTSFGNFRCRHFLGVRKMVDGDLETEQVDGKDFLPVHCRNLRLIMNVQSFGETWVKTRSS